MKRIYLLLSGVAFGISCLVGLDIPMAHLINSIG